MTSQPSTARNPLTTPSAAGRGARRLWLGAALCVFALFPFWLLACGEEETAVAAPAAMVIGQENLAVAATSELVSGPLVSGALAAEKEATVRAEVNATVLSTLAEEGQQVERGALLARLDDGTLRDAASSAAAGLRSAEEEATWAQREAERADTLLRSGAVAQRAVEEAVTRRSGAEARRSEAWARLTSAQEQLRKTSVRAPIAGTVSRRAASAGDTVMPGSELFTVVDPAILRLEAAVPAERLSELRVGTVVSFAVRGAPGQKFTGTIDRISPVADPTTRQVAVFVTVPNADRRLVAGLFAEGRVATVTRSALALPFDAVDRELGEPAVLKIVDGQVQRVPVVLGLEDRETELVEIVSGVDAGDHVLMGAARRVTPGTRVEVRPAGTEPGVTTGAPAPGL